MCKYCYEHTGKVWYLQKDAYDLTSGKFMKIFPGRFREWFYDFIDSKLDQFVDDSVADINELQADREPYTGLTRWFYNFFAKNILGGQVTTSIDDAMKVLDMGDDYFLHYCSCKRGAGGGDDYRCIFMNHNARRQRRMGTEDRGRFIDVDEAKEIVREHRKDGHFHTVMWGMKAKVDCICNCDHYCAGLYVPEIRWGLLPSMKITRVKNRDRCDSDCDICLETCYANAIVKKEKEKVLKVDENKCIGCHLCVENCPRGVFESVPRKIYYDAAIGKIKKTFHEH